MTLAQIVGLVNQAVMGKLTPEQILVLIDSAQKMALDYDALQFKTWQDLYPYQLIECVSSDFSIGNAVAGTTISAAGGGSGTIISVITTDWNNLPGFVVGVTGTNYTFTGALTFGTGSGTLSAMSTWKGPYDVPTSPPCRKIHGIISVTDADIYGTYPTTESLIDDYGIPINGYFPDKLFIPGRVNNIEKQFTFSSPPTATTGVITTEPHYRWVYWRTAQDIDDTGDNSKLIIPAQYHLNLVKAVILEANAFLMGEITDPQAIRAYFKPWWETLRNQYTPMGKGTNLKSMPRQSGEILV